MTDQPFWSMRDTGIALDPEYDPIASDPDFQILNAQYKIGQNRGVRVTV